MSASAEHGCTTAVGVGGSPRHRSTNSSRRCPAYSLRSFVFGAPTSMKASAMRAPDASMQRQSRTIEPVSRRISLTVTVAVTFSPIATGRWKRVLVSSIVEPNPGRSEPIRVKKSDVAPVETPRASTKCSSRLGLPVSAAHSLRSARFSERSIETESPIRISSRVLFSTTRVTAAPPFVDRHASPCAASPCARAAER